MKKAVCILSVIIAYGMYSVAFGGNDIFTAFWALFARIIGG